MAKRHPNRPALPIDGVVLWRMLAIVAAGVLVYWPALHGGWLWDDAQMIVSNPNLRNLAGLGHIWRKDTPQSDCWPLTSTLLWSEWQLFGLDPFGYHLVSLALHIASSLLIWRLLVRLGLKWGWLGGLLFVVHPVAVESVAWSSEIKNTLSLPLYLLVCDAWLDAEEGRRWAYARSLLLFVAALLAKTSAVMLPPVLLLYCWWKRWRVTRGELVRLAPYFSVALLLGWLTLHDQSAVPDELAIPAGAPLERVLRAATAAGFYLGKIVLPLGLMPIYPGVLFQPPSVLSWLILAALVLAVGGLGLRPAGWGRTALFGLGFFLLNALPVLGLVQMDFMRIGWVSDHLVYLPMIGLIGLAVAGLEAGYARLPAFFHPAAIVAVAAVMVLLAWGSRAYAGVFASEEALWTYAVRENPQSWTASNSLGVVLLQKGHVAEAQEQFLRTIELNPHYADVHENLGILFLKTRRVPQAMEQFQLALQFKPNYANARNALGLALVMSGRENEAIPQYEEALKIDPTFANAHYNFANALVRVGRLPEALAEYQEALKFNPDFVEAHNNLGDALVQSGQAVQAIPHYEAALRLRPNYVPARNGLTRAEAMSGADSGQGR